MCAKPHTKIYINKHHHKKINSKCGSPHVHTLVVHKVHQFPCQWHPLHYECSHLFLLWWYQYSVLKLQTQINTNTWHNPYALSTQTNHTNTHLIPHWNLYNILISWMQHSINMWWNSGAFSCWRIWWENCLTKNVVSEISCTHWFGRCSELNNHHVIQIKWDVITTYFNI